MMPHQSRPKRRKLHFDISARLVTFIHVAPNELEKFVSIQLHCLPNLLLVLVPDVRDLHRPAGWKSSKRTTDVVEAEIVGSRKRHA